MQGDNRYSSEAVITTHDHTELKAYSAYKLSDAENAAYSYSIIGIDEGQFFPGEPVLKAPYTAEHALQSWQGAVHQPILCYVAC